MRSVRTWIQESPLTTGVILVVAGFVCLFLAWNGAAGRDYVEGQIPYLISGGLVGLALVGAGLTVALVQAQRRESQLLAARLDELADALRAVTGVESGPTAVPDHGEAVIAGRSTYHQPSCHLVVGRHDLQPMSPDTAQARGLTPCRICKPAA